MTTFKTWDQYTEEARVAPFELQVSADETITIECPSGAQLMRITQGLRSGDLELIIINLCGDAWPKIQALLGTASHKALPNLVEDLMTHFDLYEDVSLVGPGGGTVKAKRPREIQALISQGYRPLGESTASLG